MSPPRGGACKEELVNLHKRFALSLALIALLGLAAAGASAQTITKATFTLPAPASWDDALLHGAGYTLSVDRAIAGVELVYLGGEGITATFFSPAGFEESSG